jgi:hypothetical protein
VSLFHLTATPDSIPSRTAPERAALAHSSCTRTLLRLRASSLLATQPASASQNPRGNAVLLSVETDNQASTGTPPAVTPACVRTIAALTSLARRRRNGYTTPLTPESCTLGQAASWQYKPEKGCVCHDASTPEQLSPSHETAVHGPTVIRHAHRRSRPRFRSAYRLPRLPNAPIGVENRFFVQLEVTHVSVTDWTQWSPAFDNVCRVPGASRPHGHVGADVRS